MKLLNNNRNQIGFINENKEYRRIRSIESMKDPESGIRSNRTPKETEDEKLDRQKQAEKLKLALSISKLKSGLRGSSNLAKVVNELGDHLPSELAENLSALSIQSESLLAELDILYPEEPKSPPKSYRRDHF